MKKSRHGRISRILLLLTVLLLSLPLSASAAEKLEMVTNTEVAAEKGKAYRLLLPQTEGEAVWSSSNPAVAKVGKRGKVKAKAAGTAVITAQTAANTYRSTVTVTQPVTDIVLDKSSYTMKQGKSTVLNATVFPADATNKKLKWSSSNKEVVTVDKQGRVSAVGTGTATIKVKAKDGSGEKATCRITVTALTMKMSRTAATIEKGETLTLKAKKTGGTPVTWGTSDRNVVTVTNGTVTAVNTGSAVVAARKIDGSQIVYCRVTVKEPGSTGTDDSTDSSGTDTVTPPEAGKTQNAQKFLSLLQKYSDRVKSDYAAGIHWTYANSGVASTWKSAAKNNHKSNCALLARWGLREMGIIDSQNFWGLVGGGIQFRGNVKEQLLKYCDIIPVYKTPNQLLAEGNLLPGDICTYVEYQHTNVYAGNGLWYDAGRGVNYKNGVFTSFGPAAAINMSGTTIGHIIRLR